MSDVLGGINEGSTAIVSVSFRDDQGVAVIPTSGSYRIDNVEPDAEVVPVTLFFPESPEYDIEILPSENMMLDQGRKEEVRRVTIVYEYGLGRRGTNEFFYKIKNLAKIYE